MRLKHLPVLVLPLLFAACGGGGGSTSGGGSIQPLVITTTSLPDANIGQFYTATLQATGGTSPYTWSMPSGSLPAGLTFMSATSTISGVPTAVGISSATFEVMDANGFVIAGMLDIEVLPAPPLVINPNALPTGSVGGLYSTSLSATGGVVPYTWTIASGNLPTGLSLNAQTGEISGTPTLDGVSNFDVEVTDSLSATAQAPMQITVAPAVSVLTPGTLPNAYDGIPYYARFDATGGQAPYNWSVVSGTLPTGLSLSVVNNGVGEITGTPTQVGTGLTFSLQVTDSLGTGLAQLACTVDVLTPQAVASSTVEVVTTNLPRAMADSYYEYDIHAAGGLAPYYWEVNNGALPPGMYMDDAPRAIAKLRGRPQQAGEYTFDLVVNDGINLAGSLAMTLVVEHDITALASGMVGTDYASQAVFEGYTGGTPTLAFAAVASVPGTAITTTGGAVSVSGTPAVVGTSVLNVEVTESSLTYHRLINIDIAPAAPALTITTVNLPDGIRGSAYIYSADISAGGGSGTGYNWALAAGSVLPPGLSGLPANGQTVKLQGSPSQSGVFAFTVDVTDSQQNVATTNLSITINDPTPNDYNGDGYADVLVGSASGVCGTGLELFLGEPAAQREGDIGVRDSELTIEGRAVQSGFGDFNGDGVADIYIGSTSDYEPPGYVSIFDGSATNPTLGTVSITAADCRIEGNYEGFASAIATGDLDGDGYDDLIIGAPTATTSVTNGGRTYIYYGGPNVLTGSLGLTDADLIIEGTVKGTTGQAAGSLPVSIRTAGYFGDSFVVADLNNDGRDDLVAGATDKAYVMYSPSTRRTGTHLIDSIDDARFDNCSFGRWPARLAVGNINGDASPDLVVGGEYTYIFYGATSGQPFSGVVDSSGAAAVIDNSQVSATGALHVIGVGLMDWNGDGIDDVFIGSSSWFVNLMYAFFGSASSPLSGTLDPANADVTFDFPGQASPGEFIYKCDYNADGVEDLMFGCQGIYYQNAQGANPSSAGAVYIVYGNASLPAGFVTAEVVADLKFVGRTDGQLCGNDGPAYGVSGGGG